MINIRPGVGILSVLRHLNYQPWFALAEFVDNSLQSYLQHIHALREVEGGHFALRVEVVLDPTDDGRITIRDNAAGIHTADFPRAFRPAEIPPDRSGLHEFGMGMKSAACWFAPRWSVRTSALGESVERTVSFDVSRIIGSRTEELEPQTRPADPSVHYTEVVLDSPFHFPYGKTIAKIKEHLTDIYRLFLRDGHMILIFNRERLSHESPPVLNAPPYNAPNQEPLRWHKEIDLTFGETKRVRGFAALRETASARRAGFALFRRNRLIQGSGDEGYRPHYVFGNPNSYRYQRLFGELHLDGFEVSHTKDGFQWDDCEEDFLVALKAELDRDPVFLLKQAENWRASNREIKDGAEAATIRTVAAIEQQVPAALEKLDSSPSEAPPASLPDAELSVTRSIKFPFGGDEWEIVMELINDPAVGEWLDVSNSTAAAVEGNVRRLAIRVSMAHPFMVHFAGNAAERIEPLLRIAAGLALAEHVAYSSGVRYASTIRRHLNDLLRNALSGLGEEPA